MRLRQAEIEQQQSASGCQIAASAVATNRQPLRVQSQAPGIGLQPLPGVGNVMQRNREGVFRREPIADGDDHAATAIGQGAAGAVIDRQRTLEPATTMGEQQGGCRSIGQPIRCVQA
ncbi:hypothetical protein G6F32_015909 [Rhizopus arrhizus]|nr:hypothetical protein G6F32_015909 [Rhizopus arrhizus]